MELEPIRGSQSALEFDDNVQFTLFRPRCIRSEEWEPLLVFAHLSERRADAKDDELDPIDEVERQAHALIGLSRSSRQTVDSTHPVPRRGELTFLPQAAGVEFDPPSRSCRWTQAVHREEFLLRIKEASEGSVIRGRVSVYLGAIIVAELPLALTVCDKQSGQTELEPQSTKPYRKIFASYSH